MAPALQASPVLKRSVTIAGHPTSVSLEQAFWVGLGRIARAEGVSVSALLRRIDARRTEQGRPEGNLSSAIRVFVLDWLAAKAGVDLLSGPGGSSGGSSAKQSATHLLSADGARPAGP
jgi:predicted DNA-binding ribbon-helix-helix protein